MKKMNVIRFPLFILGIVFIVTTAIYSQLGSPNLLFTSNTSSATEATINDDSHASNDSLIEQIQDRIRQDKQNPDLWYELGNAYMYDNQFEQAATAFWYAERLMDTPQANIYAARATALYYQHHQQWDATIQDLIEQALALDNNNVSARMLMASEHFMKAEYQDAITIWQGILDSQYSGIDRVRIINAINQAKQLNRE